ncbi:MAG: hypothetical protein HY831_05400 [Candidatus Aenigmarchaeota archaeon]|nr:hypothetical protein [Candidatus Aenigmarchaeota archaeon]
MVERFQGDVIENTQITKDVYVLKVKLDKNIDFKAGQFVNIEIPFEGGKKQKSYSIASPPLQKNVLEFCIKKVDGGLGSTYLYNTFVGQKLNLLGPFGAFILKDHSNDAVFVATGTGIAGVKPMIEDLLENGYKKKIYLVFGVRYEEDIYYRNLFEELAKKHKNFIFIPTLSKPGNGWKGEKGYVQNWIKNEISYNGHHVYICGLVPMVEAVTKTCVELGFPQEHIHMEKYV